jgi:hypothetical protein
MRDCNVHMIVKISPRFGRKGRPLSPRRCPQAGLGAALQAALGPSRRLSCPRRGGTAVVLRLGPHDNLVSSATNAGHLPIDDGYWNVAAAAARVEQELRGAIGFAHLWLAQDGQDLALRHTHVNVADVCSCGSAAFASAACELRERDPNHSPTQTQHGHPPMLSAPHKVARSPTLPQSAPKPATRCGCLSP